MPHRPNQVGDIALQIQSARDSDFQESVAKRPQMTGAFESGLAYVDAVTRHSLDSIVIEH